MERNKVIDYFEKEEKATRKNRVAGFFNRKEEMESANKDMSKVCFLDWEIIKYNWQKKKKTRFSTYSWTKKNIS